jgi:hypothetical protein
MWKIPLESMGVVAEEDIPKIFSNIEEIFDLHKVLLEQFRQHIVEVDKSEIPPIGEILFSVITFFARYSTYLSGKFLVIHSQ